MTTHAYARPATRPLSPAPLSTTPRSTAPKNRLLALGAGALLMISSLFLTASPAHAHDELVGTSVVADDTGAATGITLSYNNEIIDAGTEIVVTHDGADATDGAPVVSGRDVTQALLTPLAEGDYAVVWRVVSSDGHPIQGELLLQIAANGSGAIVPATDDDHADHDHADDEHDHADHDHADDEATAVTDTADAEPADGSLPWWAWMLIAIGGAGVVAAVITASVVGAKRRTEAMGGRTTDADTTASDEQPGEN